MGVIRDEIEGNGKIVGSSGFQEWEEDFQEHIYGGVRL